MSETQTAKAGEDVVRDMRLLMERLNDRYGAEGDSVEPWSVTFQGREWLMATDAHLLVAVHRELLPSVTPSTPRADVNAMLANRTSGDVLHEGVAAVQSWAEWVDLPDPLLPHCAVCKNTGDVPCSLCDGRGGDECVCHCGDEHTHQCHACDNSGIDRCAKCARGRSLRRNRSDYYGAVAGRSVDRQLLARGFEILDVPRDSQTRYAMRSLSGNDHILHIIGETWFLLLMGVRDDSASNRPAFAA